MPLNYPFTPHLLQFSLLPIFLPIAATGGGVGVGGDWRRWAVAARCGEQWWRGTMRESRGRQRQRQAHVSWWRTGCGGSLAALQRRQAVHGRRAGGGAGASSGGPWAATNGERGLSDGDGGGSATPTRCSTKCLQETWWSGANYSSQRLSYPLQLELELVAGS
jgi:hypothetical protein